MSEVCSHCEVVERGPYCPVQGVVHRPFRIAERYDVDQLLRASASSFVFAAHDRTSRRTVAVKVLRSAKADDRGPSPGDHAPEASRGSIDAPLIAPAATDRVAQQQFQRAAATLANLPPERAAEILNVGHDAQLGIPSVVLERPAVGGIEDTAWSLDLALDAQISRTMDAPDIPLDAFGRPLEPM